MLRLRTLNRSPVARKIRRHRRPIAAALAAVSVMLIVGALRPPAPIVVAEASGSPLVPGEVGVPITLANAALTTVIRSGDHVDVIALTELGKTVLAQNVRIADVMDGGLIVLAAQPSHAAELAATSLQHSLTITIHPRAQSSQ
jgi:hypothetical protein